MSYGKFGFPAMTNNALGNKATSKSTKSTKNSFIVRVINVNLTTDNGFTQVGTISGEQISSKGIPTGKVITNVFPSDPYRKIIPLVNEFVKVSYVIAPNTVGGQFVYSSPLSLYGIAAVNVNSSPSPLNNPTPNSQTVNYLQSFTGATNIVPNDSMELNYNSPNQLENSTFIELSDIHPLLPFEGDILYEGRWGNSIRFGSTVKSKNSWSESGTNGDPILILRNGQDPNLNDFGAEPVVENIKQDLSSIYLTSTQQLKNFSLANENFISYTTPPITPASYTNPQITLNSSRIILNANSDSILISGEKSVGISSNSSINIEAKQIYLDGTDIRLGRKNASQAVLKGNDTVDYLKILITELKNLATALKTIHDWPSDANGIVNIPVPNTTLLTTANAALSTFESVYNSIDSIKSNFVKTI
jgi:hypothetical protein